MDQLLDSKTNKDAYIVPPYARDIRLLILTYLQRKTLDLMTFKKTWMKLGFSQLWNAKPDDVDKRIYAKEIFNCVLSYFLVESHELPVKFGALYTMYFLYETQPGTNEEKTKIPMIPHIFYELLLLREKAKELKVYDAFHCLNRLIFLKAYLYTMDTNVDYIIGCIDPSKSLIPDVLKLNETLKKEWNWQEFQRMIQVEDEYTQQRSQLFSLVNEEEILSQVPTGSIDELGEGSQSRNPFSRVAPNFLKNVYSDIKHHLKNREEEWEIYKHESLLRSMEETYISIEQQSQIVTERKDEDSQSYLMDRADRLVRVFRPESMKLESDSESEEQQYPQKRRRYS